MMDLRGRAVQKLARGWKDDPEILAWIKQLATSNARALAKGVSRASYLVLLEQTLII
jgi:hypothetical protein